jgi:hypothetical protein
MTVEPVNRQSLLERRSLLFSPEPRLGWVFRALERSMGSGYRT